MRCAYVLASDVAFQVAKQMFTSSHLLSAKRIDAMLYTGIAHTLKLCTDTTDKLQKRCAFCNAHPLCANKPQVGCGAPSHGEAKEQVAGILETMHSLSNTSMRTHRVCTTTKEPRLFFPVHFLIISLARHTRVEVVNPKSVVSGLLPRSLCNGNKIENRPSGKQKQRERNRLNNKLTPMSARTSVNFTT